MLTLAIISAEVVNLGDELRDYHTVYGSFFRHSESRTWAASSETHFGRLSVTARVNQVREGSFIIAAW